MKIISSSLVAIICLLALMMVEPTSSKYLVDTSHPFELAAQTEDMNLIMKDFQGNILVSLSTGTLIKYSSELLNQTIVEPFTLGNIVESLVPFRSPSQNWTSCVLNINDVSSQAISVIDGNNTVYALDYDTLKVLYSYLHIQKIVHHHVYPLQLGTQLRIHATTFQSNQVTFIINQAEQLIQSTTFDIATGLLGNVQMVILNSTNYVLNTDNYLGLSNGSVILYQKSMEFSVSPPVVIQSTFKLNGSINHALFQSQMQIIPTFSDIYPSNTTVMYEHLEQVQRMFRLSSDLLVSQSISNSIIAFDVVTSSILIVDPSLQMKPLVQIYSLNNSYYFLYEDQTMQVFIDSINHCITGTSNIQNLTNPENSSLLIAGAVIGDTFSFVWFRLSHNLYQISDCLGQSDSQNESSCISYACNVADCQLCTLDINLCDTCIDGYLRQYSNLHTCNQITCSDFTCQLCFLNQTCIACITGYQIYLATCINCNIANCMSCNQSNECNECTLLYNLVNNTCISCNIASCSSCMVADVCCTCSGGLNLLNNSCIICTIQNCILCSTDNICSYCTTNYSLEKNTNSCIQCLISNCSICQSPNICSACSPTSSLSNNSCISCSIPLCASCSTPNICTTCQLHSTFINYTCLNCSLPYCLQCLSTNLCSNCQPNYQLANGLCISCAISFCLTCSSDNLCSNCQNNYSLVMNSCVSGQKSIDDQIMYLIGCNFLKNSSDQEVQRCQQYLNKDLMYYIVAINKFLVSTPNIQQIVTALSPMCSFMNDYWYYLYHNRSYENLFSTNIFLNIVFVINNQKIIPFLIPNQNQIDTYFLSVYHRTFKSNSYLATTNEKVYAIDEQETYFTLNIFGMLLWNYTCLLLLFVVLKLLKWLFQYLFSLNEAIILRESSDNIQIKQEIYSFICSKSTFSCFLVALFENNAMFISFYATLQLKEMFHFNFFDKINAAICLIFLFISIIMGSTFYIIIYSFKVRYRSTLNQQKINVSTSYIHQSAFRGIRNVLFGVIQAYFIESYLQTIVYMLTLKIILVIIILTNRKIYRRTVIMSMDACYFLAGSGYDLLLLVTYLSSQNHITLFGDFFTKYSLYFELVFIFAFIAAVIIQILYKIMLFLIASFKKIFSIKQNKIGDQSQLKKKSSSSKKAERQKQMMKLVKKQMFPLISKAFSKLIKKHTKLETPNEKKEIDNIFDLKQADYDEALPETQIQKERNKVNTQLNNHPPLSFQKKKTLKLKIIYPHQQSDQIEKISFQNSPKINSSVADSNNQDQFVDSKIIDYEKIKEFAKNTTSARLSRFSHLRKTKVAKGITKMSVMERK